jgi:hypothetical protein
MSIFNIVAYPERGEEFPGVSVIKDTSKILLQKKALAMMLAAIAGNRTGYGSWAPMEDHVGGTSLYSDNQYINLALAGICGIVVFATISMVKD